MKQKLFLDAALDIITTNKYAISEKKIHNVKVTKFKVDKINKKNIKRTPGDYYTITYNSELLYTKGKVIIKELVKILKYFVKNYNKNGTTLIIGLGNSSILADALGPITTNKIIATNHYEDFLTIPKIALFVPEVIGKTGISSYNLISMLVRDLKPDTIIIVDSLATTKKERIGTTIEVSDTGIIPSSSLKNNKEINNKTFNIPVILIGIPLLLEIEKELYTKPDIRNIIDASSEIIASAINETYLH